MTNWPDKCGSSEVIRKLVMSRLNMYYHTFLTSRLTKCAFYYFSTLLISCVCCITKSANYQVSLISLRWFDIICQLQGRWRILRANVYLFIYNAHRNRSVPWEDSNIVCSFLFSTLSTFTMKGARTQTQVFLQRTFCICRMCVKFGN